MMRGGARVMDIVLCDSFDNFLLKLSYTMVVRNRKILMSLDNMEDILEFMNTTLTSNTPPTLHEENLFQIGE